MSSAVEKPDAPAGRPTWRGRMVAMAVGLVLLLALAEGLFRVITPEWREFDSGRFMSRADVPSFGRVSTGRPGFDGYFAQNNGDFRVRIRINAFGLRNSEPVAAAHGRVWIVGDSMAFGWGVARKDTYTAVAGRLSGRATYNVASPGTSVCGYQALLARMPKEAVPAAVVLGLVLENDILPYDCRRQAQRDLNAAARGEKAAKRALNLLDLKRALTRYSALYNFLTVSLKRVDFVREALTAIGAIRKEHVFHVPRLAAMDRAVGATVDELVILRRMLPADMPFAVLLAPARFEIRDGDTYFAKMRALLTEGLKDRGIEIIDPMPPFREAGFEAVHFAHDGHWSPLGHAAAAQFIARWLARRLPAETRRGAPG